MTASRLYRVESFVAGLAMKAPCRAVTTGPITLSGLQTINTYAGQEGDRILVKDQLDPIENGIYTMEVSTWQRDGDFDGSRDVVGGTIVPVWDHAAGQMVQYQVVGQPAKVTPDIDSVTFSVWAGQAGSSAEADTLQSVTDRGNTTDNDMVIQTGGSLTFYTPDDLDNVVISMNDTEQAYPFMEFVATAACEVYRFDEPLWVLGDVHIGGAGTNRLAFYGYGDAVEGSISQDGSGNISVTAVGGDFRLTGTDLDAQNNAIIQADMLDFSVDHQTLTSSSGSLTWNYTTAQSAFLDLTENITTWSFTNPPASGKLGQLELEITQDAAVAYTITWPASVEWPAATEPDLSTLSSRHVIHFRTIDGGTRWLATHVGEFG